MWKGCWNSEDYENILLIINYFKYHQKCNTYNRIKILMCVKKNEEKVSNKQDTIKWSNQLLFTLLYE